jgi:drug/metabolite transporter (DMT)-like permease
MEGVQYSAPVSRLLLVVVGVVAAFLGVALLGLFGVGLHRLHRSVPSSQVVFLCIVGALGMGLCVVALRLLTGKHRRDGGLFSPWVLRVGGVIFLFGPVAAILNRSWFGLLEAGVSLSAALACFVLANRRHDAAANDGAPNGSGSGP